MRHVRKYVYLNPLDVYGRLAITQVTLTMLTSDVSIYVNKKNSYSSLVKNRTGERRSVFPHLVYWLQYCMTFQKELLRQHCDSRELKHCLTDTTSEMAAYIMFYALSTKHVSQFSGTFVRFSVWNVNLSQTPSKPKIHFQKRTPTS